jgi:hypothetical protein
MTLDFPTLGYPTNPILIFFLSLWKISNCLNILINAPFPNGFVMLERYAIVGYYLLKTFTHLAMTHIGTKSALLINNTMCLCGKFFFTCSYSAIERVPIGSLASKT